MSGWLKRTGSPILYGCAFFSMLLRLLLLLLPTQTNDKTVGSFDASLHCTCALLFTLRMMTPLVNQTQNRVFKNIKKKTRTASKKNSAYDSYNWAVSELQGGRADGPRVLAVSTYLDSFNTTQTRFLPNKVAFQREILQPKLWCNMNSLNLWEGRIKSIIHWIQLLLPLSSILK